MFCCVFLAIVLSQSRQIVLCFLCSCRFLLAFIGNVAVFLNVEHSETVSRKLGIDLNLRFSQKMPKYVLELEKQFTYNKLTCPNWCNCSWLVRCPRSNDRQRENIFPCNSNSTKIKDQEQLGSFLFVEFKLLGINYLLDVLACLISLER